MDTNSKTLLRCQRFQVERVEHTTAHGDVFHREVIRHPGSVVILPLLRNDRICLIRNFRASVHQTLIELPAGTREPGESVEKTASRELTEETGFRAGRITLVASFFAAPGILDEEMTLFLAENLVEGEPQREAGEEIENLIVTKSEALQMVRDGEIRDAKTIVGLCWPVEQRC